MRAAGPGVHLETKGGAFLESIRQYWKRTDKVYLLLCIFSSTMAVLALASWAAKQGNGFATDAVTGPITGIGAYRRALDAFLADPYNDSFELPDDVIEELNRTSHRHYSPGFYFGREQARQATDSATYIREWEFVGTVDGWENGVASCQQRGKWSLGDTLEVLCPDGRSIPLNPEWIKNEAGELVESTPHAMERYTIPTPELPPMSLLRRKV